MGAAANVEKLDTRITLSGVETVQRGQGLVGAGFRAMRGDIRGAATELKQFKLSSSDMMIAGGVIAGAGAGMLAVMRQSVMAAAQQEEAQVRLTAALRASGAGGGAAATEIARLASALQSVTTAGDEQIVNAAAMLASFKMSTAEIKEYLPRLVDIQQGLRKLGKEEMDLEQIAIMLGKGHAGMITGLRRVGIMVDQNAYKTRGYKAIIEEVDKEYGGQGRAAADTYAGSLKQLDNAVGDLYESLGVGLLGPLRTINSVLKPGVELFTKFNTATHGAAGTAIAVAGGLAVVSGGILLVMPGIRALRDMWLEVAGAASAATVAQRAASTAGAGAGASAATGTAVGGAAAGAAGRGILGKLGGVAKGLGKGLGAGMIIGLAGGLVSGVGAAQREKFIKSNGKSGGIGAAAGTVGGGALTGAAIGATVGSIVPGVGTAIGGAIGAAGGALYSLTKTATDKELAKARGDTRLANNKDAVRNKWIGTAIGLAAGGPIGAAAGAVIGSRVGGKTEAKTTDKSLAVPKDPVAASSNAHLRTIADLMKSQTKAIVGGGKRTSQSYNQADIQRAVFGMMGKAVV